jgi:hypothetical protein
MKRLAFGAVIAGASWLSVGCGDPVYPHVVDDAGVSNPCANASDTPGYPTSGCGTTKGQKISNFAFTGRKAGLASPVGTIHLGDWFDPTGASGVRYLAIGVSSFWCVNCKLEAPQLASLKARYGGAVAFFTDVAQTASRDATSQSDVDAWIGAYHLQTAAGSDGATFALAAFFDPNQMPLSIIVDVRTMTIVTIDVGGSVSSLQAELDSLTGKGA